MLTLADLGVLRDVAVEDDGRVIVWITPTYSGCPAIGAMRDDLEHRLAKAGYPEVEVRTVLAPAWSSDWISAEGRRKLAANGISPPGPAPRPDGPVLVQLTAPPRSVRCPGCGSVSTRELSEFGATACKSLWRCSDCDEPFEHFKEH